MQVLGQNIETTESRDMALRLVVDSVTDDGVYLFTATIEDFANQSAGSFGGMDFSSEQLPDEVKDTQPKFSAAKGMAFTFEFHPDGTVQNVDGVDPILDAIVDTVENIRPFQKVALRTQVSNALGGGDLPRTLSDIVCIHPPSDVGVGDSWIETYEVAGGVQLTVEETVTFTERAGSVAVFDVALKTTPQLGTQSIPLPGASSLPFQATGNGGGQARADIATGFTLESNSSFELEGTMSGVPGASGVELPIVVKVSSRMESRPG
jgi:hypothetical protein